ncbi:MULTISPECIES: type I restriction endonuclease subunit R [Rhizobium]|uniref:type I restriction endonuclease subunit R n=1 Tax=Rhizobium TaxID=379 RepID=UPI0010326082|nr:MULTISPECIES: type I restriction endonuclease subunit R [Rhizobium]TBD41634.1 type I restriction endonuclease subunit R [Rhizobium ruizarguesonis]TBF81563.1 type I restriction endonuclease subunit R [Rhizobium leguminosarum]TBH01053.1 type I restriction endonuclease subunit R [Rhizobium leguminosarum]
MAPSLTGIVASEDGIVEKPALALLRELGWQHVDLHGEVPGSANPTGRTSFQQAFLPARLKAALRRLNPNLPAEALTRAEAEITRDRSAMLPVAANREVLLLIRNGIPVQVRRDDGKFDDLLVRVIDWGAIAANDFLVASQVWIDGVLHRRRPDTIGFVNGLPLLLAEWKGPALPLADAYDNNLRDYRDTIPQLFPANGFVILSNGLEAVMGASHTPYEIFAPWKRLEEDTADDPSLETLLRATCEPARFLDLIENFVLFDEARGGLRKIVGKYHQVLGVNRAIGAVRDIESNQGRLGVFWHTQGSGKSLSMVMFAEKVLRRLGGNYTFVIVTDRTELDDQIAGQFASAGALTKDIHQAQAGSRTHLKELLAGNERYVFTLIQKFSTADREPMPVLSERSDIIVMTDEAHRSQYDQLAANMRAALPNASFIGFTGTPLIQGEESRTREVFGDYVSVYDFAQSVRDGATVPLFYEARKPELQLNTDELREELDTLLDEAMLDEEQEKKLSQQFGRQYTLITAPDRLDKVAEDVALHFAMRGYRGKAMFVAIDKATAVAMHDRVKAAIARLIAQDKERLKTAHEAEGAVIAERLMWLHELDMAVVVSQSQNEIDDLRKKGLDILPHRERMQKKDLEAKFKDPNDPLRLVFVCAMWITGFDVPTIGTVYLDKPMKNHTLMQTIARANRRAEGKTSGVIVDYVGVFQNLQKALAIYAGGGGEEPPIKDKEALVAALEDALTLARAFVQPLGVEADAIMEVRDFDRLRLINQAIEILIAPDDRRREFLRLTASVTKAYKALLPDERAAPYLKPVAVFHTLSDAVRARLGPVDISAISARIAELLDEKLDGVAILTPIVEGDTAKGRVDLSGIDFDKLATLFAASPKVTAEKLREGAEEKARKLAANNPTRQHLVERLEKLVADYNAGSVDAEQFFEALKAFIGEMDEEERRAAREELTEEELAIFDLLTNPEPKLSKAEEREVKRVARSLLEKLHDLTGAIDWVRGQETRGAVWTEIRQRLNELPENPYPQALWDSKVEQVWDFVLRRYA